MSLNQPLSDRLDEIGKMMDLLGEDSFRANAHLRAARAVADMSGDIAQLAADRPALLKVEGIGPKMADKIIEFCNTGAIQEHIDLRARVPGGLLQLLQVPGLGPKTVRAMWVDLKISDPAGLKKAIDDGSLLTLPRMGAKAVEKIKTALAFAMTAEPRLWLGRGDELAATFLERLAKHEAVARVEAAGSLRRGRDTIGDLDILVALKPGKDSQAAAVSELFRTAPGVQTILAAGDSKSSVRVSLDANAGRWKRAQEGDKPTGPTIQVDLRVLPLSSWGSALMYFTGSKDHNIRLRERALKMGMTLNEWGLFPLEKDGDDEAAPHKRGVQPIAAATEEEIYAKLGLPYFPPEVREDHGEFEVVGPIRLIEVADIKAELHAHTTASDGALTIEELAEHAKARGFHTIAVTDHSRSSTLANGLSIQRLVEHIKNVQRARAKVKGITILAGSEVDILVAGTLDYPNELLKELDIVVASPHAGLTQDPQTATKRLVAAMSNPYVHILGHPTGRLINRRQGLSPDMGKVIAAALEHDVALEINAHWMRLDLRDVHVRAAAAAGCKIAIDCDVHAANEFSNLKYGVATARRGWVTPQMCVNTWDAGRLHAWLKSKGRR